MNLDTYSRLLASRDEAAKRLAFEISETDSDSHVPALLIVAGIVALIALLAAVQHMEALL